MCRHSIAVAGVGALLLLSGGNAFPGQADDVALRGQKIYVQFCQGCHGADKSGLTNFSGEREDLQRILEGDTDQMPDFYGVFSGDEVTDIYAYLIALSG